MKVLKIVLWVFDLKIIWLLMISIFSSNFSFAQKRDKFEEEFEAYSRKYEWKVSRELIEKRTPASVAETNFDEKLVPEYSLPDILTLNNGIEVKSVKVWEQQRRHELLDIFTQELFGKAPPKPADLTFQIIEHDSLFMEGEATFKRVAISFQLKKNVFKFHLNLLIPNQVKNKVPVFLVLNHRGDSRSYNDGKSGYWPDEYLISRGYALASIYGSQEIDPDSATAKTGIRNFYQKYYEKPEELTWGTLGAWAWGFMRAVDYLETDPQINANQIAIIGHSRGGKTSLWAGAQDTRIALVIPHNAGDGGPAIVRRRLGNTIEVMTGRNPHWFVPKYATYAKNEDTMPFDQHMLVALVAPRGYHGGDGSGDLWHDPRGSWISLVQASKVWALYGNTKIMTDKMPLVNDLFVIGPVAYHLREGGHGLLLYDWKLYLDHADILFKKKP